MVIDVIFDRMEGCGYDKENLYDIAETDGFNDICKAFDNKNEIELKQALNSYIDEMNDKDSLHKYINENEWL